MAMFTLQNVGCLVDGARGYKEQRLALAKWMEHLASEHASYLPASQKSGASEIAAALRGEMSDDDSETFDALDLLNLSATDGRVYLEFVDGDLMCCPIDAEGGN